MPDYLRRDLRLAGVILAAMAALLPAMTVAQEELKARRILLLHPTELLLPGAVEQDALTRKALTDALPAPLEFYSFGFDEVRSLGPSVEDELVDLLQKKFSEMPPDLVVFHGPMHENYKRNRDRLWGAPVMFIGVAAYRLADPAFPKGVPAVSASFDLPGTVDLALQFQPQAKRILLIAGTSSYDRAWAERAPHLLESYRDRLEIELSGGRPLEALDDLVTSLTPETIVIYLSMYRDGTERVYTQRAVIEQLSRHSPVPIYVIHGGNVGTTGALGGSVANWTGQHDAIVDVARRLMAGEPGESIRLPAPIPAVCRINWPALAHWNIPASRVPEKCEIVNRDPSFWMRYRTEVILISLIVLLQAAVIALLLRQRYVRRQNLLQAERQRLELAHASRLSMVGALSASIAHEINQPLAAIHMNASVGEDLLNSASPRHAELKEILADIRRDDERAGAIIKRLREMLQKRPIEMSPIDINETLNGVLPLLGITARHREILIRTELGAGLPQVSGDRVQLQQVVMNLIMNAIETMAESPPERRVLSVRTTEQPEGWIEVSVSDAGPGIAPDVIEKIFDPFFTTKREGMGLGLSISRSIVQSHGGRIWVQAGAEGATFRFALPVSAVSVPAVSVPGRETGKTLAPI